MKTEKIGEKALALARFINAMSQIVPQYLLEEYKEFFDNFSDFLNQCGNKDFLVENIDTMVSSLNLFGGMYGGFEGSKWH